MINSKIEKGILLLAEPTIIGDLSFNRSVILLAEHSDEGSVGFILNKPLQYTVNELVPDIEAYFEVYNGGPVEQDNLYFVHTVPHLISDGIKIAEGIYWGGNFDQIKLLINNGEITKNDIRFFLGYSGWSANQLEEELELNSWIILENSYQSNLLKKSSSNFWKEKIQELGGDYLIWSNAPENPILN